MKIAGMSKYNRPYLAKVMSDRFALQIILDYFFPYCAFCIIMLLPYLANCSV